ncbi:PREDICTED: kelch-like protein 10, partial [Merops nubicus]|uniref:kelch-like protein 10 n=1 Tax=Merops nubicus TaxID=57421 RepID=UPI0004F07FB7
MERNTSPVPSTIFNELRLGGEHCDVTMSVDGVEFGVHKIILCRCSNYFRALFSKRWNNTEKKVYKIQDTSPEMMRLIIEYAYTGTVPLTADNVRNLLVAAHFFRVMGIVRLCCEFLKSQLSLENCISTWRLTDTYFCPDLRAAAHTFILQHFEEVTKVSTEFVELSASSLEDIIGKDELNVRQEDAVVKAILRWIAHNPQSRRQHVAALLGKVRLARMPTEYLLNIRTHNYVQDNEECHRLISKALTEISKLNMLGAAYSDSSSPLRRPRLPHDVLFDRLYAMGGFDGHVRLNTAERYEPETNQWTMIPSMHERRSDASATTLHEKVYICGGFDGIERSMTAEVYSTTTNQWAFIASMGSRRGGVGVIAYGDEVYV